MISNYNETSSKKLASKYFSAINYSQKLLFDSWIKFSCLFEFSKRKWWVGYNKLKVGNWLVFLQYRLVICKAFINFRYSLRGQEIVLFLNWFLQLYFQIPLILSGFSLMPLGVILRLRKAIILRRNSDLDVFLNDIF